MKYWNKDKKIRKQCWTKVAISNSDYSKDRFLWCQRNSSAGKFYRYYGSDTWWFENEQDATLFLLRWS